MVSMGPYTESYNNTHMFNMPDLNVPFSGFAYTPGSIFGYISENKDFSKFMFLITKAKLESYLNEDQANLTLFVPSDKLLKNIDENVLANIDLATARHIILFSSLNRKIDYDLLSASPMAYFITKNPTNKILVENLHGRTILNGCSTIVKPNIELGNGMIHIVDNLLLPPLMTIDI